MFYLYNKKTLQFEEVKWVSSGLKVLAGVVLVSMVLGWSFKPAIKENYTEDEVILINSKFNKFDNDKLIEKIKEFNFRFPYIVYAQSILETGHFKKQIFIENHNLFGMKYASKRVNLTKGTQYEHAFYSDWTESLTDYALYTATYLYSIKTEAEYLSYLGQHYAEDENYITKLKDIIKRENIKSIFN